MARRAPNHRPVPHAGRRRPERGPQRDRNPQRLIRRAGPPDPRQGAPAIWTQDDAEALLAALSTTPPPRPEALADARERVAGAFPSRAATMALTYVDRHADEAEQARWIDAFGSVREHTGALPMFVPMVRDGQGPTHRAIVDLVERMREPAGEPLLLHVIARSEDQPARLRALEVWSEQGTRTSLATVSEIVAAMPPGKLRDRSQRFVELAHERYGIVAGQGALTEVDPALGGLTVKEELDRGTLELYHQIERALGQSTPEADDALEDYESPPPPYLPVFVGVVAVLLLVMAVASLI